MNKEYTKSEVEKKRNYFLIKTIYLKEKKIKIKTITHV